MEMTAVLENGFFRCSPTVRATWSLQHITLMALLMENSPVIEIFMALIGKLRISDWRSPELTVCVR